MALGLVCCSMLPSTEHLSVFHFVLFHRNIHPHPPPLFSSPLFSSCKYFRRVMVLPPPPPSLPPPLPPHDPRPRKFSKLHVSESWNLSVGVYISISITLTFSPPPNPYLPSSPPQYPSPSPSLSQSQSPSLSLTHPLTFRTPWFGIYTSSLSLLLTGKSYKLVYTPGERGPGTGGGGVDIYIYRYRYIYMLLEHSPTRSREPPPPTPTHPHMPPYPFSLPSSFHPSILPSFVQDSARDKNSLRAVDPCAKVLSPPKVLLGSEGPEGF